MNDTKKKNPSNRVPGMRADELVKRTQEGSLIFEPAGHEHDTTQSLFK